MYELTYGGGLESQKENSTMKSILACAILSEIEPGNVYRVEFSEAVAVSGNSSELT